MTNILLLHGFTMSKTLSVNIKDLKNFDQTVPNGSGEAGQSYLSRLGSTLKSAQQEVNLFLTQKIEEEKSRGETIEDIEVDEADSSDEEETQTNGQDATHQSKRIKSC